MNKYLFILLTESIEWKFYINLNFTNHFESAMNLTNMKCTEWNNSSTVQLFQIAPKSNLFFRRASVHLLPKDQN